jgi:diguanylate cyclase (GGDEF)-like protein
MKAPGNSAPRNREPGAAQPRRRLGRVRASIVGALIVALGLAASGFVAAEWQSSLTAANKKSFASQSADLASALESKLAADTALTRTLRALATMEPGSGESRFLAWYRQLELGATPPSPDVAATLIEPVSAAQLPAFRAQAEADPAFRALSDGKFQIVPPGSRAVYCLTRAYVAGSFASRVYPLLLDYCAPVLPTLGRSPFPALMRTAVDGESAVVVPVGGVGNVKLDAIGMAVYRSGSPLATNAERQSAVTGFIATTFDAGALLRELLRRNPSVSMTLYHSNTQGRPALIARSGPDPKAAASGYRARTALGGGWLVATTGAVSSSSANAQGLYALASGIVVTLLVFLLYVVLLRSRQRAWGMVAEKTDELEYLAMHDPLTGLPNRSLVLDRAQQFLARGRRLEVPVTALFVDIDGFKQINDVFGHQMGDEVLREVGRRLDSVLRDSDTVGRLGGDEFVMLADPADRGGAERLAQRILDALALPFELPTTTRSPVTLTASIGVTTGLPASAEQLLADADLAMYQAKARGKGAYVVFESAMHAAAQDRTELETGLAEAIEKGQLTLVYQPIVELDTQRVLAAEALLRWKHPTRGDIAPDVFIPIAEASGLIIPIGLWVLQQACAQCAAWHRSGLPLAVSVNASARQFERSEFVGEVRGALADGGLDPAWLTLEITETVLMNRPRSTEELLVELKTLGVQIAIDDFGTGYSSL